MKRILLLLTILATMGLQGVKAYSIDSRLLVTLHNNQPFEIYLDGQRMGNFSNRHKISNLAPGHHRMKIVVLKTNPYTFTNGRTIVYDGNVSVRGGFVSNIIVQCDNRSIVYGDIIALAPPPGPCGHCTHPGVCGPSTQCGAGCACGACGHGKGHGKGHGHGHGKGHGKGHGYGKPGYIKTVGRTLQQPIGVCGVGTVTPGYGQLPPQVVEPVYGPVAIDDAMFNELVYTLKSRTFESTRKQIAMQWIHDYNFTSAQIREIMLLMTFESTKMTIAKAGYLKVVDPEYYHLTFDALTFDSSVNRLLDYMATV